MLQLLKSCEFLIHIAVGRASPIAENFNFFKTDSEIISLNNLITIKETEEVAKKRK